VLPLLVSVRFQVLFHSPYRSSFHLSLTVLCAIGHRGVFSLGRWSSQLPTGFLVSRGTRGHPRVSQGFVYGAITRYGGTFQSLRLPILNPTLGPHNPRVTVVTLVWANPRSLATTDGISIDFFSCRYLDVSVPCVRLVHLCIQCTMTGYNPCRVSPFGNLRIKARLAAPRSLSQLTTSFIASRCQGIHRTPLVA
jgi:hypothetical protein